MRITLKYSRRKNAQQGNILRANLNDMVWSLGVNLKRHHKASCTGEVKDGVCTIDVIGAERDVCDQYIDTFRDSMDKLGFKLMISYT